MKIYQVGGAVRDKLLGLPVKDHDWVVVGSTPEEMEGLGYQAVGKDFPVFLHPETHEEYALARTERKTAPGYKGFNFNTSPDITLEEDLQRRDLTINAMAIDEEGNLIDLFNGRNDLESGILRHVSNAFIEDPIRVLRVARFGARFKFTVADETIEMMKVISKSVELDALVPERVWTEMEIALQEKYPVLFFAILRECNALIKIFPEIDKLFGIPQPERYHPEIDSGVHTMMVLEQAAALSDDTVIRFAALVHDLGKGNTPREQWPGHRGHEERSVELIHNVCNRYRIPNKYRELAVIVARHHLDCHRIREMRPETIMKKLDAMDAFRRPERFAQYLIACEADARGRKGLENHKYTQADEFKKLFDTANSVSTDAIQMQDLDGEQIGLAIRQKRLELIEKTINREN